ncbi:hypothetical protein JAAARDRAFT_195695 [Jaapia argillacea MUCL 33604]|uniref:Uncharacterized protein n=1 Tax=Jaapia argillacea MUCL 33604 TaxID=933084 RepID=A0A067PM17_9AGAM|nr:hypothetical protein JAAARDRAFT_195695 [Jaapia argillacea MUCL 33604]
MLIALAMWLHWFFTAKEKLGKEVPPDWWQMIRLVTPFVHLALRHPTFYVPDIHYELPLVHSDLSPTQPRSARTAHGPWPNYRSSMVWGRPTRKSPILVIISASQYLSLQPQPDESISPVVESYPFDDIYEFNVFPLAIWEEAPRWNWWEGGGGEDERGEDESKPPSVRSGRGGVPSEPIYVDLVRTASMPPSFTQTNPFVNGRPVYMHIQEHHCISPNTPYPFADVDEHGINNAWFPIMEGAKHTYETYIPGKKSSHSPDRHGRWSVRWKTGLHLEQDFEEMTLEDHEVEMEAEMGSSDGDEDEMGSPVPEDEGSPELEDEGSYGSEVSGEEVEVESEDEDDGRPCDGVGDIVFTGKTDTRHGEAWDAFQYYGCVCPYDGLTIPIQIPICPSLVPPTHPLASCRSVLRWGYLMRKW